MEGEHEPVRVTFTPGSMGCRCFRRMERNSAGRAGARATGSRSSSSRIGMTKRRGRRSQRRRNDGRDEAPIAGQDSRPEITEAGFARQVEWLADEKREGRMTGSAGAQAAANWLADYFRENGLKSFAENYALPFQFNAGERVLPEKTRLEIRRSRAAMRAKLDQDFRPLAFQRKRRGERRSRFRRIRSGRARRRRRALRFLCGLDVKDKIVLILRYVPGRLNRHGARSSIVMPDCATKRCSRASAARKRVLVVTGPNSPQRG